MGKLYIGFDRRGEKIGRKLAEYFNAVVVDNVPLENFTDNAFEVAKKVRDEDTFGILICGSGIGMCIAANKIEGARAAVIRKTDDMENARQHNNCNVFCFGVLNTDIDDMIALIEIGVNEKFLGGKYAERIKQL